MVAVTSGGVKLNLLISAVLKEFAYELPHAECRPCVDTVVECFFWVG